MFQYNGFTVEPIGPVVIVRGGYSQRVRIVDCPAYIIDKEFSATVTAKEWLCQQNAKRVPSATGTASRS